jgi:hypothetical protein
VSLKKELTGKHFLFFLNVNGKNKLFVSISNPRHYKAGIGQSSTLLHKYKDGFDQGIER